MKSFIDLGVIDLLHGWVLDVLYKFKRIDNTIVKELDETDFKPKIITRGGNNEIWACFLPWGFSYEKAKKYNLLPPKGNLIVYPGVWCLGNPDPKKSKKLMIRLSKDLQSKAKKMKKTGGLNILGISIGGWPAYHAANSLAKDGLVKNFVNIFPGDKLSDCLWEGDFTWFVRIEAKRRGFSQEGFRELLKGFEPIENIDNLPPNKVYILLATHDRAIPAKNGLKLIEALEKDGKHPKIKKYLGYGHCTATFKLGKELKSCKSYLDIWK